MSTKIDIFTLVTTLKYIITQSIVYKHNKFWPKIHDHKLTSLNSDIKFQLQKDKKVFKHLLLFCCKLATFQGLNVPKCIGKKILC